MNHADQIATIVSREAGIAACSVVDYSEEEVIRLASITVSHLMRGRAKRPAYEAQIDWEEGVFTFRPEGTVGIDPRCVQVTVEGVTLILGIYRDDRVRPFVAVA